MRTEYNVKAKCNGMPVDDIINTVMKDRGVKNIDAFLEPTEGDMLPLDSMKNIDKGVTRVKQAIEANECIGVLWDVDTDGVCSGTIITQYLKHFTNNIKCYINNGKIHGLNDDMMLQIEDINLLIIVDSLDEDCMYYSELNDQGIDIIILDHHHIKESVSYDRFAILISSQVDYQNPHLSGAGVTWKFCKALDETFETDYADDYADLAACGIVADMSDVSQNSMENRYIVKQGLDNLKNPVLKKIVGGYEFDSQSVSFSIAPIVNAANRTFNNELLINAFMSEDKKEITSAIKQLKSFKEEQNVEINSLQKDVTEQTEKQLDDKVMIVFIDTPYAIAGLLANKLVGIYQRPVIVLSHKDDRYTGSGRAVGIEDFRDMCDETGFADAIGHPSAFGIRIDEDDLDDFCESIQDTMKDIELHSCIDVDIEVNADDINKQLVEKIRSINNISGTGFPSVKLLIRDIDQYEIGQMSEGKHLTIKPDGCDWMAIKWNWNGNFDDMEMNKLMNVPLTLAGTLNASYIGRRYTLEFICDDVIVEE